MSDKTRIMLACITTIIGVLIVPILTFFFKIPFYLLIPLSVFCGGLGGHISVLLVRKKLLSLLDSDTL